MDSAAFVPRPSTLYAVATPIGNLRDITLRALDVLRGVDCVAAEDTRVSGGLFAHFGISVKSIPLHAHNEKHQSERVVALLAAGKSVALVTDAGTPGLSDPGALVVAQVRRAGFAIEPIPGPSALTAALSVTGWPAIPFAFNGFLPPRPAARKSALDALSVLSSAQIFFEAPHRITETLDDLVVAFGPDRRITIARELTKRFETVHETTLGRAVGWIAEDDDRRRGEFVLVVEGAPIPVKRGDDVPGPAELRVFTLLRNEVSASRAAKLAAEITGKPRRAFYQVAIDEKPAEAAADEPDPAP
ncbi:MAG: 16S rRNA (cytidine(1402)-2'-O)-methyltransferase [Betaproteobacteria bacterium]